MFFDRDEIHIQVFANVCYGKFIFSDPHLHKILLKYVLIFPQKNGITWYIGHTCFENFQKIMRLRMTKITFPRIIADLSCIF